MCSKTSSTFIVIWIIPKTSPLSFPTSLMFMAFSTKKNRGEIFFETCLPGCSPVLVQPFLFHRVLGSRIDPNGPTFWIADSCTNSSVVHSSVLSSYSCTRQHVALGVIQWLLPSDSFIPTFCLTLYSLHSTSSHSLPLSFCANVYNYVQLLTPPPIQNVLHPLWNILDSATRATIHNPGPLAATDTRVSSLS